MWIAARDPDSHDFAVRSGCNVMVTPLMKGDAEVIDLKRKFDTAVANPRKCPARSSSWRHTHIHTAEDPTGGGRPPRRSRSSTDSSLAGADFTLAGLSGAKLTGIVLTEATMQAVYPISADLQKH